MSRAPVLLTARRLPAGFSAWRIRRMVLIAECSFASWLALSLRVLRRSRPPLDPPSNKQRALAKAQDTARRGLRTLFLCYNRPLKDWLIQAIPKSFSDDLVIDTYHGIVEDLCRKAASRSVRRQVRVTPTSGEMWRSSA